MRIELHDGFYLSPVRDGDQAAYVEHFSDKDTTDRLLRIPYPYTVKDANNWVQFCVNTVLKQPHPNHFALRRTDGFLIGGIGLQLNSGTAAHRAELGYWIARDYCGRGLATLAVRAMVRYAFQDLGLRRVEAISSSKNLASHRVLEKAGFTREGLLAGYNIKDGILIDAYMFALVDSAKASPS